MSSPTLSVLMPNYNHAQFIPDALEAMLAQSYRPLEIIILDDGSTDDSLEVIERYRRQAPEIVSVVRNDKNRGLLANGPRLLDMARGDFVFFSAMDDRILPGFLERSMRLLSRYPTAGLCSTLCGIINEQGISEGLLKLPIVTRREGFIEPADALTLIQRHGNWFMGNTTIFRTRALRDVNGFRPDLGPYCDGFVSLIIAAQHGVCFVPEPLAEWRRMPGTYSQVATTDVSKNVAVLRRAEQLMRSEYCSLFTDEFISDWKNELYFGVFVQAARSRDGLASLGAVLPFASRLDVAFQGLLKRWPAAGVFLSKPYLFARLRRGHVARMILRRLAYLRLSMRWA